jgi:hypothetical protein
MPGRGGNAGEAQRSAPIAKSLSAQDYDGVRKPEMKRKTKARNARRGGVGPRRGNLFVAVGLALLLLLLLARMIAFVAGHARHHD